MVDVNNENSMRINLKRVVDDSYDIIFGYKLFPKIAKDLKELKSVSKCAIITDSTVKPLYGDYLDDLLKSRNLNSEIFSFKAGEKRKTEKTCMRIIEEMSELKFDRDAVILALGGGVVGDMAGWIAANYLRGIPYIQIPTTTLAQADSSIGGKTGIDTEFGKNLIGAFKQPKKVYIDVRTLKTLNEKDYRTGLVETIKHGIIQDAAFFGYLERDMDKILKRDPDVLLYLAKNNCGIKGSVVEKDPEEKGLRRILNYGHTIGHAVEKLSNYRLSHGEAVAIGIMAEGVISNNLGYISREELERQEELFGAIGTPITIPKRISNKAIIEATTRDKKAKNGCARYCLPKKIGEMNDFNGVYATYVNNNVVEEALNKLR